MDPTSREAYDRIVPTPEDEATQDDAASEPVTEPVASTDAVVAASAGGDGEEEEDDPFPPALIVRLRAPDRAVSRTIGAPTPAHVGPGASITFGLSVAARSAQRQAVGAPAPARGRANVLSLPHPRLEPRPARIETTVTFDGDAPDEG